MITVTIKTMRETMKKIMISLAVASLFISTNIFAAGNMAVVSVERLLAEAPQVEAVNASMLKRFGAKRDELKKIEKEVVKLQEEYKRNELVMTKDKLEDIKTKIIKKIQTLKQKEATLAREVSTVRNQELAVLQKQIKGIIVDIAKANGYDIVFSEGVAYANNKMDITDKVLAKMKSSFKKK